jgi:DNA-binding PadR family transcriptional regulator
MVMPGRPDSSPQTRSVLAALRREPSTWRHGYDIAKETELASGTLYPILGRLADRGLLETCWEADPPEGRPRRHLYRLTAAGVQRAAEVDREPVRRVAPRPAIEGA